MPRRKSKNPSSCPRGKKLVKIGARKFCAKTGGKKKTAGARSRKAGSKTAWKTTMAASCKRMSVTKFNNIKAICKAAGVKSPSKKKKK